MKLSVFTPTHNTKFLRGAFKSLLLQTHDDWEWVIAPNKGAQVEPEIAAHKRVRVLPEKESDAIGELKRYCCENAEGELLVELDHDDLLFREDALALIARAASENRCAGMFYSNSVRCDAAFKRVTKFSDAYGWRYREASMKGLGFDELIAFEPSPASVSRIWFAPDHVRAFRRTVYDRVGGHGKQRVLDDLDLMCRMYLDSDFAHIDAPLYLYRIHGDNEWIRRNKEIQDGVWPLYDRFIQPLALAWAKRAGLRALDLGAAHAPTAGFESVDLRGASVACDLEARWPFADNSVGVLRAADVLEHLRDPVHAMKEAQRVLVPGGYFFIQVPSTDGRGAFQDPTHKSFWNENSFLYYTDRHWANYINTPVRFQAMRCYTTAKDAREVCWARAHLVSLKGEHRPPGIISI